MCASRPLCCIVGRFRQHLGQRRAAREDLDAALELSEEIGHRQLRAYTYVALADLELLESCFAAARAQIQRAEALDATLDDQHLRALIATSSSRLHALTRDTQSALATLQPALAEIVPSPAGQDWALLHTALAFAYYFAGQHELAVDVLERVIPVTRQQHVFADCAQGYLILAASKLAQGATAQAMHVLTTALDLAAQIDGTASALLDARWLPALLPLVERLPHPLAADLIARLATPANAASERAASETSDLPIRVLTLGDCSVSVGDRPVDHWRRPLSGDLLLYLLGCERPVRKSEILQALWPEKSERTADDEFRRIRSDLKKALGRKAVVEHNRLWRLAVECDVDAPKFLRLADHGASLWNRGDSEAAARELRQALDLWHGPYLNDHWSDWAVTRREAMQSRYHKLLDLLAEIELRAQAYDDVERLSALLLEENPYHEGAHRRMMICFAQRGDFTHAQEQFLKCCVVLRRELGIGPSAETIALNESIKARARRGTTTSRSAVAS